MASSGPEGDTPTANLGGKKPKGDRRAMGGRVQP